ADHEFGVGHPQFEHRQQALPAGEHLDVPVLIAQELHRLLHAGGSLVFELAGNHGQTSCTSWIACQTREGRHGISISVTPRRRTASSTPLTIAGVAAIVPASPTPLTPSALVVEGV